MATNVRNSLRADSSGGGALHRFPPDINRAAVFPRVIFGLSLDIERRLFITMMVRLLNGLRLVLLLRRRLEMMVPFSFLLAGALLVITNFYWDDAE